MASAPITRKKVCAQIPGALKKPHLQYYIWPILNFTNQALIYKSRSDIVSFPDPTIKEGKGSGDIGEFSWSCIPSHAPIQLYANSHMNC